MSAQLGHDTNFSAMRRISHRSNQKDRFVGLGQIHPAWKPWICVLRRGNPGTLRELRERILQPEPQRRQRLPLVTLPFPRRLPSDGMVARLTSIPRCLKARKREFRPSFFRLLALFLQVCATFSFGRSKDKSRRAAKWNPFSKNSPTMLVSLAISR